MTHVVRDEARWKDFQFKQPYAKGLARVRDVLANTSFDPATLWQWGTMQAMALVEVLEAAEKSFGAEGQKVVGDAIARVGLDVGRQILAGVKLPEGCTEAEFFSFYATMINCVAYASLERPVIDDPAKVTFDITFCPHQDHYEAFDCRIQRYFVRGMIEAAQEHSLGKDWQVKMDTTIPSGHETCHFTLWKATDAEARAWNEYTQLLEAKALVRNRSR